MPDRADEEHSCFQFSHPDFPCHHFPAKLRIKTINNLSSWQNCKNISSTCKLKLRTELHRPMRISCMAAQTCFHCCQTANTFTLILLTSSGSCIQYWQHDKSRHGAAHLQGLKHFIQQGQLCTGVLSAARSNAPASLQSLSSISVFLFYPLIPHISNSLILFLEKKFCYVHI